MSARVRVFMAMSLDGFIAGEHDDLSWLPTTDPGPHQAADFGAFMADVGVMLMGRHTHDVVQGMGAWIPVRVITRRPLHEPGPTVSAVAGSIDAILAQARADAAPRDVYLDGGDVIRQALRAGLVDELIITLVPILLGSGVSLFQGLGVTVPLTVVRHESMGTMVQLVMQVMR